MPVALLECMPDPVKDLQEQISLLISNICEQSRSGPAFVELVPTGSPKVQGLLALLSCEHTRDDTDKALLSGRHTFTTHPTYCNLSMIASVRSMRVVHEDGDLTFSNPKVMTKKTKKTMAITYGGSLQQGCASIRSRHPYPPGEIALLLIFR